MKSMLAVITTLYNLKLLTTIDTKPVSKTLVKNRNFPPLGGSPSEYSLPQH